ncbi:MAG TPA: UvrD-helicase domain-containing protein [Bacteroidales bacterium]|nr:UvrD-helicase domain-containing protein [Bacteroidales bacterium]
MADPTKNFIVYKASAGSGKTYTLVKEYLKLVLADPNKYRHILAVTFTNKAAYEMKSRVITCLKLLSDMGDGNISEKEKQEIRTKNATLIRELSVASGLNESELAARSNMVLHKILHNYSDFAISTIDSFVQKIIRTFAYDLKLAQNFEIELDSERVLSEAVDVLFSYAGSDEEITSILIEFIKQKMDDGQNWDIENDLKTFAGQLLKEDTQKYIALFSNMDLEVFPKAINGAFARRNLSDKNARKLAADILKIIADNNIDPKSFYQGNRGIPAFFQQLAQNGLRAASPNSYCAKAVDEDVWYSKSTPETEKQKIDAIKDTIAGAYTAVLPMHADYLNLTVIIKSLYPLSLLSQIEKETEAIKADENLIFISDFYRKINEQLLNEPVPFIYQRAGEKYEHYFIDEFQDTSVLQFQNMLPLIENAMASGNANLIVGDGKQAIYRWRSGEVMQFAALPEIYKKPELAHFNDIEKAITRNIINYEDYADGIKNVNYRTKSEIINFNNGLFEFLAAELLDDDKKKIYDNNVQQVKPGNIGGYVRIRFFEGGETYADEQLNNILEIITELKAAKTSLKDIAVICRANQQAADIASFLLHNGIDVVSSESLLLSSSQKVNFIISLFRYLNSPDDELAAAFILYYLQDNYQTEYNLNRLILMYQSLKKDHQQKYPLNEIFKLFNIEIDCGKISLIPLYDLSEYLIRLFDFTGKPDPFVIYFLDAVNEFVSNNTPGIPDFIEWWDDKGAGKSIVVPDKLDAVKIMTIHKAKGLEFPVVIYPFADESVKTKGASIWVENTFGYCPEIPAFPINVTKKSLEGTSFENYYLQENSNAKLDMLNICYVALTRPEDRLYILSKKYDNDRGAGFGFLLKKYLKHIEKWDENSDVVEFGDSLVPPPLVKQPEKNNTVIPEKIFSSGWADKMVIRYNSSILWEDEETAKSISWGNVIHKILSEIRQAEDTAGVIARMVLEGVISDTDAEKINKYLDELMTKPEFKKFFEPGLNVLTEAEILTPAHEVYRPDRIIFEKDKNFIIDFKTGAVKETHKTQITNYADLLVEINGKPVEKYLIYLREDVSIVKV